MKMIARPSYDALLQQSIGTSAVKVLTGIRRCGKSTLLKMLIDTMLADGFPEKNIFYRRFDQFGMPLNPTAEWLLEQLNEAFEKSDHTQPFRIFLDEIQQVEQWELAVRQMHTHENMDVFITGSNAYVLSSDLATFLAGRYKEIKVHPLSFTEYKEFAQAFGDYPKEDDQLFELYLRYGGMPGLFEIDPAQRTEDIMSQELSGLFDAIVLNDVVQRGNVRDFDLLSKLVRYTFSTSGSLFSTKRIADALTSAGRKVKPETVDNYLHALMEAFALYECEQEGVEGKKVLRPLRKLYPADTGFRNMTRYFSPFDLGYQLENVVYLELLRRGYQITVGALPHAEVAFIARKGSTKNYFQVCTSLMDEQVFEREIEPLEALSDSFEKTILTLDTYRLGTTESGIRIQSLIEWLTSAADS